MISCIINCRFTTLSLKIRRLKPFFVFGYLMVDQSKISSVSYALKLFLLCLVLFVILLKIKFCASTKLGYLPKYLFSFTGLSMFSFLNKLDVGGILQLFGNSNNRFFYIYISAYYNNKIL